MHIARGHIKHFLFSREGALFIPLIFASLILAQPQHRPHLIALCILGTLLCLLNMLIGVGGGSFANSQAIPFLSLPALNSYLSANFDTLERWLALLHLGTFIYVLVLYLRYPFASVEQVKPAATNEETISTPTTAEIDPALI